MLNSYDSKKNREACWKYYYPEGNGKAKPGFHLHHKDPSWKKNDPDRYRQWNPCDVIMLTEEEHKRLHGLLKGSFFLGCHHSEETKSHLSSVMKEREFTEEHRRHLSEAGKGRPVSLEIREKISKSNRGKPAWNKGKPWSAETKRKMSESKKGKHTIVTEEQRIKLSNAARGKKWYHYLEEEKLFKENPGEPWILGRLPKEGEADCLS